MLRRGRGLGDERDNDLMGKRAFNKILAGLKEALGIARGEQTPVRVWHVDRDGRVRTDKDRPVMLKASSGGSVGG